MANNRHYKCRDVDMLMAADSIVKSFETLHTELSATRTDWTPEYITALKAKIEKAMAT